MIKNTYLKGQKSNHQKENPLVLQFCDVMHSKPKKCLVCLCISLDFNILMKKDCIWASISGKVKKSQNTKNMYVYLSKYISF
jgi:hypothetical protein